MQVQYPLDEMTLADKLNLMESLWLSLARSPEELPSPDWHRSVLVERKRLVEEGQLQCLDWENVIRQVREDVYGNLPA